MAHDLTPDLLAALRTDLRDASDRVDRLAERVDDLIAWIDELHAELSQRVERIDHTATDAVASLAQSVSGLAEIAAYHADLPARVEACETAIVGLRRTTLH